jgi:hypothetical protein
MSNLEYMAREAALEKNPDLIDAKTRSLSMIVREAQAWRERFPKDCARVNAELDFFRKSDDNVTTVDENMVWRRWFPDFTFRAQDDLIVVR